LVMSFMSLPLLGIKIQTLLSYHWVAEALGLPRLVPVPEFGCGRVF